MHHMYRIFKDEFECIYTGEEGRSCLTNDAMLPYIFWPDDAKVDDSAFTIASGAKDYSAANSPSVNHGSTMTASKKKSESFFSPSRFWYIFLGRNDGEEKQASESIDTPGDVSSLDDPDIDKEDLPESVVTTFMEVVRSSSTPSECQGITARSLIDENKSVTCAETTFAQQPSFPGDTDLPPPEEDSLSKPGIFSRIKRSFGQGSVDSKSNQSDVQTTKGNGENVSAKDSSLSQKQSETQGADILIPEVTNSDSISSEAQESMGEIKGTRETHEIGADTSKDNMEATPVEDLDMISPTSPTPFNKEAGSNFVRHVSTQQERFVDEEISQPSIFGRVKRSFGRSSLLSNPSVEVESEEHKSQKKDENSESMNTTDSSTLQEKLEDQGGDTAVTGDNHNVHVKFEGTTTKELDVTSATQDSTVVSVPALEKSSSVDIAPTVNKYSLSKPSILNRVQRSFGKSGIMSRHPSDSESDFPAMMPKDEICGKPAPELKILQDPSDTRDDDPSKAEEILIPRTSSAEASASGTTCQQGPSSEMAEQELASASVDKDKAVPLDTNVLPSTFSTKETIALSTKKGSRMKRNPVKQFKQSFQKTVKVSCSRVLNQAGRMLTE